MSTVTLTVRDGISRYPNPKENLPSAVRTDGPRTLGKWNLDELKLEGNEGGLIPPEHLTWLQPIPADAPIEEIRKIYRRDGVVHVRGLLPRKEVLETRRKFFEFVSPSGVLKEGTDPVDGIYDSSVDPTKFPGPSAVQYDRNQNDNKLLDLSTRAGHEQFILDLSDSPTLLEFVGKLMDGWKEPFRFRRQLLRTNIPRSYKTATRVHYDQMYLRRMEPGAVTGWIPIGDVSPISGGLMYLEDSMSLGLEIERAFMNINSTLPKEEQLSAFNQNMLYGGGLTKDANAFAQATNRRWMIGDYRAGDVVFHHSCMIHCSANNEDPKSRIRFATDVRFADRQARYDEAWDKYYYVGDKL